MAKKTIEGLNMFTADGRIEGPGSTTRAYRLTGSLGPKEITEATADAAHDEEAVEIDFSQIPPCGMPFVRRRK
jgi:hypothetical protein